MAVIPQGGVFDIEIFQGGSFTRTFALREADQSTILPLTGYTTGQAEMRDKPGGDIVASFAVAVAPAAGEVTITMSPVVTAPIEKSGFYDVALIHENGVDVLYLVEGAVSVNKRVTEVS